MDNKLLADRLKQLLGSMFGLYFNTHAAHWNIEGINFSELHKMLGEQYEAIWESIDGIAEQIRQIDAYAPQTLARMLELNTISALPPVPYDYKEVLSSLQQGNEVVISLLNSANELAVEMGKQGLSNYLCGLLENHSKYRWFLRVSAK
jgi:starvation-inducible DNA-binding protein